MPTYQCPKPVAGLRERVTDTDSCGIPVAETVENSRVTTNAFISFVVTPDIQTGADFTQTLADGTICVTYRSPDSLRGLNATQVICGMHQPLLDKWLATNNFVDGNGDVIGGALPSQAQQADVEDDTALQVELWQRNQSAAACGSDGACAFLRHIFPLVRNRQISGNVVNAVDGAASEVTLTAYVQETEGYEPSIDGSMSETNIATMQESGPWGWICEDTLPDSVACGFDPVASGS